MLKSLAWWCHCRRHHYRRYQTTKTVPNVLLVLRLWRKISLCRLPGFVYQSTFDSWKEKQMDNKKSNFFRFVDVCPLHVPGRRKTILSFKKCTADSTFFVLHKQKIILSRAEKNPKLSSSEKRCSSTKMIIYKYVLVYTYMYVFVQ